MKVCELAGSWLPSAQIIHKVAHLGEACFESLHWHQDSYVIPWKVGEILSWPRLPGLFRGWAGWYSEWFTWLRKREKCQVSHIWVLRSKCFICHREEDRNLFFFLCWDWRKGPKGGGDGNRFAFGGQAQRLNA